MAKYYRKRFYRKRKYNIENRTLSFKTPQSPENNFYQNSIQIVPPSLTEGVRQATRFTITLTNKADSGDYQLWSVFWALVYIPEGATTTALFPGDGTSLFQPSNYVLASGVNDPSSGPIRIHTSIKKNLNANDQIYLLTACPNGGVDFVGLVRYAICYN